MVSLVPEDSSLYSYAYSTFRVGGLISWDGNHWWSSLYSICLQLLFHAFGISARLYWGSREFQDTIEQLSTFAAYAMALTKSRRFIKREKHVLHLLGMLESIGVDLLKDEKQKNSIKETENSGRKVLKIISVFTYSTPFLSFTLTTIFDYMTNFENKRLIAQVWVPWSMEETWAYILAKIWACLMGLALIFVYRAIVFFDLLFTYEMSAYLKILQNYLETEGVKDKKIYEHHKVLIQLIYDYNELMSGVKYLETLIAPLMPCGFGLALLKALRNNERSQLDSLQKMICCLISPIITCYCGQEIITQVERLHEASYMNNWYEESPRHRKDLLMVMIRTTKVTTVNYRLFVTFDHDYLTKVLQRIYSYFMLIISFQDLLI